ncbi:hypothetical protein A2Y99_04335, partial [Candidatus Gottesmanbacteria bacterium RBG_13_37_7]
MKDYQTLAKDYDFLFPEEEVFKQKSFFKKIIKKYSIKSCLDCACGTGSHLLLLHHLGLKCYGSDLSPEMLTFARKKLKDLKIPLHQTDFRNLSTAWKDKFDLIICMTTSFPHMLNDEDAVSALKSMYDRLNNNGILIIDNGFSDFFLDFQPKLIPARITSDRAFYFFMEYPEINKVIYNILEVKKRDKSFSHLFESISNNAMRKTDLERYFSR